jgi:hypothetical protein
MRRWSCAGLHSSAQARVTRCFGHNRGSWHTRQRRAHRLQSRQRPGPVGGVAPGGKDLLIAFEDLPTGAGDNDFQDVVIGVRTNHDGLFFV